MNIPLKIVKLHLSQGFTGLLAALLLAWANAPCAQAANPETPSERTATEDADTEFAVPGWEGYNLYPDLTQEQSDLAHLALNQAYSSYHGRSRKTVAALRALETAKGLPPLGYLLSVAIDVMRFQNGDFEDEDEEKALLKSIHDASEQGGFLCRTALAKQPDHPTYLLISGGIRGFSATLKIHGNPSHAMNDGFQALKLLERSRGKDARIKDSYMGTGIFNSTAANAPLFVRATLKIIGRSVTMKAGLEALRVSAYKGQYTSVSSQLFLIQFLSPYEKELMREKREIFRSLEESFPRNPYYTFLKIDEALCFHPDSFYTADSRAALAARIANFASHDFSSRRYGNLVRYQYTLLDSTPSRRLAPDTSFAFRDYAFYPAFIDALRFKRRIEDSLEAEDKPAKAETAALKAMRDSCLGLIRESPMNPTRKRYHQWHVSDALRWTARRAPAGPDGAATTSR